MSPQQAAVADEIVAGPRGGLRGPFHAWLRSPALASRFQKVGEYVRFNSSLPAALNELAILITARYWTSQYEWYAHRSLALQAGLPPAIADDIAEGREPAGMSAEEQVIWRFCTELHRDKSVSDPTFDEAIATFGERGVIDLVGVCGYYTAVSMTLNVAQVSLPEGAVPLRPLARRA